MKKHTDQFSTATVFILLGVVLFFGAVKWDIKTMQITGILSGIGGFGWLLLLYFVGHGKVVENKATGNVCYKNEGNEDVNILQQGNVDVKTDGVSTAKHTDKVFKISNGMNARITEDGSVKMCNVISQMFVPGWKSRNEMPDNWQKLFDAAQNGGC